MRAARQGFTLVELLIVVAIIGLLAAIAVPIYMNQVAQTHRGNAQEEMMQYAQAMERCFTDQSDYSACEGEYTPDLDRYDIDVDNQDLTATTFTIQATPVGNQKGDRCGTMTVNHLGRRTAAEDDCWN